MTELRRLRLPVVPPAVGAPLPFGERRNASRRAEDHAAADEARLLAGALDALAEGRPAEERLANLLALIARTVGARRAAVLTSGAERRVAVYLRDGEDETAAAELARWLDVQAPRPRAEHAAAMPPAISFAALGPSDAGASSDAAADTDAASAETHYTSVPIPGADLVVLGFDFADRAAAESVESRLPRGLAHRAGVALAVAADGLARELEIATLRARDTERTQFVATVAHELRTPLTGLSGYLDLILEGRAADPVVVRDFLERSQGIVSSMSELVSDLLELSRLESGTLGLELRPISLREVGDRIAERIVPLAMERGIALQTDLPPHLRTAYCDRRRVEQVLTNLAANAVKFSSPGGTVELVGWFDGHVALLAVRDDGPGIGPDDRPRIFDRFYRMNGHERITGTGLGLPIARDLARAMNGDLDVASVPGSGSSFVLALPGPAAIDPDVLTTALMRTLAAEEIRLEERAVIRAIQAEGRTEPLPLPRILPGIRSQHDAAGDRPRDVVGGRTLRPTWLRAIDVNTGRPDNPTPA